MPSKTRIMSQVLGSNNLLAWTAQPPGTVLQVINRTLDGTTQAIANTTSLQVQLAGWSQTITKIKSNSKIVCLIDFYNYQGAAPGGWWYLHCKVGAAAVSSANSYGIRSHNPAQWVFANSAHQAFQATFWDVRDQTNITYDFYHQSVGSIAAMVWWNNPVNWTFMEIAQ